ncbi:ATP-dependent DNA ligase [Arthrobacter sp.]|uniref:ATP-dependent DNA ligase n=1 Tax=Arthrobacter sp. TaxID=1667 RepID=UPI0025889306|nr:ATP-dependent DNA ligase [Arthrobacter sp.]
MAAKDNGHGKQDVTIDGHRLPLTNLDKVLYPETGTTKADVLEYYTKVAPYLIAGTHDRPATRKRWVNGVGTAAKPGLMFFQKNLDDSAPDWVPRATQKHKDHTNVYPLVNDLATLTWLGQIATLEIHVPQWRFDARGRPANPDRLVLDLDPGDGAGLAECAEVARLARVILADMDLDPVPVTSGSKGIHLYAALDGKQTSDQVSDVAHELARALEADHPDLVVSRMRKELRGGKVFVDWSQNNANKTTVAPYSLRGRSRPWVAAPRTWRELASSSLAQLDHADVLRRLARRGDPLAALAGDGAAPTAEAAAASDGGRGTAGSDGQYQPQEEDDPLAVYRAKRDPAKTPEPVPAGPVGRAADGNSFVIQEHHASRLHWDFRLEHDGVLVSWALPKGVPTDPGKNHLAVQTEDHPLDYGSFEGTIPAGEYGGGQVAIWDSGSYELEKWRDGKEIIATLTGRPRGGLDGPRRYALINTSGHGPKSQWLIHLMKDQGSRNAAAATPSGTARTPMLATLGTGADLDGGSEWSLEFKWDGIRALVTVSGGSATLTSRNGNDLTDVYPELAAELAEALPADSAVLDGEIVALDASGRPDFGVLQTRMKLSRPAEVRRAAQRTPVHYLAFDILDIGGTPTTGHEFAKRRALLEELMGGLPAIKATAAKGTRLLDDASSVQLSPIIPGTLKSAMASSRKLGLEGLMAKRTDSPYREGRRSPSWIKLKHDRTQEVVVGGWRDGKGARAGTVGSLLVGVPDADGRLTYAGRVGSGFSERELTELGHTVRGLARKTTPLAGVPKADAVDAHWVTPKLVGEVAYTEWTGSGRLRHPVWRGWRLDKDASDVARED